MNKFKNFIYLISFLFPLHLNSSFSKESYNNTETFKESREFSSEDSEWFTTAVSLELFPQDYNPAEEQIDQKIDFSSDEPNISYE